MKDSGKNIIDKILENLGVKAPTFAENIGVSYQRIFDIQREKTKKISSDLASKILEKYPHYNYTWLLTGEGDMLKAKIESNAKPVDNIEFVEVPLVPIFAQGGYPRGYGDVEYIDQLPTFPVIVDRTYKGKYRVFEVDGDSMDDGSRNSICDKDKILCREVRRDLWKCKLHIKDWYFVIVHKTDGITVKEITNHNLETGDISCHPLNPMFNDFTLNLDDVVELYNVVKIVDRNTRI